MTTTNYVMKVNFVIKMKISSLLILTEGLCEIVIDFMTMINHQKNIFIKKGYLLFIILL